MLYPLTIPRLPVGTRVYIKVGPYQGHSGTVRHCRGLVAVVQPDVPRPQRLAVYPLIAHCVVVRPEVGTDAWRDRLRIEEEQGDCSAS